MNVLSLFDGMSCGQIALKKLGVTVQNQLPAKIEQFAIKLVCADFPDIVLLRDEKNVKSSGQHLLDEFDCSH